MYTYRISRITIAAFAFLIAGILQTVHAQCPAGSSPITTITHIDAFGTTCAVEITYCIDPVNPTSLTVLSFRNLQSGDPLCFGIMTTADIVTAIDKATIRAVHGACPGVPMDYTVTRGGCWIKPATQTGSWNSCPGATCTCTYHLYCRLESEYPTIDLVSCTSQPPMFECIGGCSKVCG